VDEFNRLAYDLLWTWQPRISNLFRTLDPERWEQTHQNPVLMLKELGEARIADALKRDDVKQALDDAMFAYRQYYDRHPPFLDAHAPLVIGYFSLEFGLAECLPIYSGGLGVLAGDHLKATSDLGLPLVAVSLFYKQGFGRQEIDAGGRQVEVYAENRGGEHPKAA
jgi:starch phosphorylase